MAYEAMNNAGHEGRRLFVILNDNEMSHRAAGGRDVGLPFGALAGCRPSPRSETCGGRGRTLPEPMRQHARRARQLVTGQPHGGTLFEELGFDYIGPVDGHDLPSS